MDKLKTLEDIFKCYRFLRIPDYQRGYAWRNDNQNSQLDDFWNDLEDLQNGQKHYTGVLTLEKVTPEMKKDWQNNDKEAYNADSVYYIIDGQQRLTTSVILIKVLLDSLEQSDKVEWFDDNTKLETIKIQYIGDKNKHGTNYYFFGYTFDNPSFDFLKAEIFEDKTISTISYTEKQTLYTHNLAKAKEFFKEKVSNLDKETKKEIFIKLTKHFKFNVYEVDKETDVFMAFETMNNRGKPLSKLELLKNRLIYLAVKLENPDLRIAINECWKVIYHYLGKDTDSLLDEDEFLEDHWIMYYIYNRKESQSYVKYLLDERFSIKRITHKDKKLGEITSNEIEQYILSLKKCVEHWYYLHNITKSPYTTEVKFWLDKLKRLRYGTFKPLLMSIFTNEENNKKDICNFLKASERFLFVIFMIADRQSNVGNSHLYYLAHLHFENKIDIQSIIYGGQIVINNKQTPIIGINGLLGYYFWFSNFENIIEKAFEKGKGFYDWKGIRYFLYEYELELKKSSKNSDIKVSWDKEFKKEESIEHILPQTPTDKSWQKVLEGLTNKQTIQLTHSLGNLVLLSKSKNSSLQNKPFEQKKNGIEGSFIGFKNGSYAEQEINEQNTWSIHEIQTRCEKLIEFLLGDRWDIKLLIEKLIQDGYEKRNFEEIKDKLCFKV